MLVVEPIISGEQLAQMPNNGRVELVKGQIVSLEWHTFTHALLVARLSALIGDQVIHKQGHVLGGGAGVYTQRQPDTVRGVDVAFVSANRFNQRTPHLTYLDVTPELIVEVLSPYDRWAEVAKKLDEYFAAGALQVWIVEPEEKLVYIYTSPTQAVRSAVGDTIADVPFLPGLTIAVQEIFDVLPQDRDER